MSEYQGINIPKRVTIVKNVRGQGYVVPADDAKALESARSWASTGQYIRKPDGSYQSVDVKEPPEFTYDNGKFTMKIEDAADDSYNGGKLSFWNCLITAPDGNTFLVGINADFLCETILHSTIVNGTVQGNIWLGKSRGRTLAVTESQPAYKQAFEDEAARNAEKTAKYEVGDVVRTLGDIYVYAGVWYEHFDARKVAGKDWYYDNTQNWVEVVVTLYDEPIARQMFFRPKPESQSYGRDVWEYTLKKPKRIVTGKRNPEAIAAFPKIDLEKSYIACDSYNELVEFSFSQDPKPMTLDLDLMTTIADRIQQHYRGCKCSIRFQTESGRILHVECLEMLPADKKSE